MFTPPRPLGHLRSRGHNFQLPECHSELSKIIYYLGFEWLFLVSFNSFGKAAAFYRCILLILQYYRLWELLYFTADVRLTCLNKHYLLTYLHSICFFSFAEEITSLHFV